MRGTACSVFREAMFFFCCADIPTEQKTINEQHPFLFLIILLSSPPLSPHLLPFSSPLPHSLSSPCPHFLSPLLSHHLVPCSSHPLLLSRCLLSAVRYFPLSFAFAPLLCSPLLSSALLSSPLLSSPLPLLSSPLLSLSSPSLSSSPLLSSPLHSLRPHLPLLFSTLISSPKSVSLYK